MISIDAITTLILANTTYTNVGACRTKNYNLAEAADMPAIYVGYASLDSSLQNGFAKTAYDWNGENINQIFEIDILCPVSDLRAVWINVYKAIIGHSPANSFTSAFNYVQGGVCGIDNGKIWWLDRYSIGFPTTNLLVV